MFRLRGAGAEPPPKRPFNWELERQRVHQEHIQQKDKMRRTQGSQGPQLKRKCVQQLEVEEHVRKALRQEEHQVEEDAPVDNGLSQLGSFASLASTTVEGQEPSQAVNVLSPMSAPVVVLSSTGPPSEPADDDITSVSDDGEK